jgi:CheY-like chemotaxis protein
LLGTKGRPQLRSVVTALPPILLVDDNHDDLLLLQRLLTRAGFNNPFVSFDHANNAARFLEAALQSRETQLLPAAIFSDKTMPEFDGFELLKWVRQQPDLATLTFVLLTSVAAPGDEERALELGATAVFEKFPAVHVFAKKLSDRRCG